ncbi:MAG: HAMP domain-containing histidine kinase [Flavobacterium sp.]|nr:HAMP domain-containing histidine kinase [Flavobacterium sp.]
MTELEEALKERVKELTCLYEVTSYISNDKESTKKTLTAIAFSIKKAMKDETKTQVLIKINKTKIATINAIIDLKETYKTPITIFNKKNGSIHVFTENNILLEEEKDLLKDIASKISNYIERIEDRKREKEIKRKMEQADRLVILGEITAGIAHELNTPLTNILGFSELLLDEFKNNKAVSEDINKIINNAIFSREIVKKLMFFSCEMPQKMRKINIVPTIKNAIDFLNPIFKKQKIKHIILIDKTEIYLNADSVQLTQIIFNLLMNAVYFSPQDGLVTISVHEEEKNVILKISDEGKGIPINIQRKIFQPFFTTKPIGEGSGLGLSVVHGIVSSHKGNITIENNSEKGVTFVISLPKNNK